MRTETLVNISKKAILLPAMAGIMFALTGCGKTTVDLNKYVTIEESGYDTVGTASVSFDYDAFSEDYSSKIELKADKKEKEAKELLNLLTDGDSTGLLLSTCVSTQLDKYNNLSNGDTITLTWNCMDDEALQYFNCKLKYSDMEYTVSNLQAVGSFNPFDYIEIEFTGIAPNGQVRVNTDTSRNEMYSVSINTDVQTGLSNGDIVTVTAQPFGSAESFINQYGSVLEQTENTYTVEGLPAYLSSASEIPTDTLAQMQAQAEDVIASSQSRWYSLNVDSSIENITYIGNIFLKRKDGAYASNENKLYLVYKVLAHADFDEPTDAEYYYPVGFSDLLTDSGACIVDTSQYISIYNSFYIKGTITDSAGRNWSNSIEVYGLESLDDIEREYITPNRADYIVEDNIGTENISNNAKATNDTSDNDVLPECDIVPCGVYDLDGNKYVIVSTYDDDASGECMLMFGQYDGAYTDPDYYDLEKVTDNTYSATNRYKNISVTVIFSDGSLDLSEGAGEHEAFNGHYTFTSN